jgi:hypothetical protein
VVALAGAGVAAIGRQPDADVVALRLVRLLEVRVELQGDRVALFAVDLLTGVRVLAIGIEKRLDVDGREMDVVRGAMPAVQRRVLAGVGPVLRQALAFVVEWDVLRQRWFVWRGHPPRRDG